MIIAVLLYAGNILVGKAINDLPPVTIAYIRLLIAFLILLPIGIRAAWRHRSAFRNHIGPLLVLSLTGIAFFNTFIYASLQFTSTTNVAVLETVIPVVTVILSALLLKERLRLIQWTGIAISFGGAVWVVMNGQPSALTGFDWNRGDSLMIGAILTWAAYSIAVKKYMHLFPPFGALLVMTGLSLAILFPMMLGEWVITGIPAFDAGSHSVALLYLGIFPSFIALVCYNRAVDLIGPSKASVCLNLLPVFTMIGAWALLNETITVMQIAGSAVVIVGVMLTTQSTRKKQAGTVPLKKTV
ncbi:EamA family transporter [Alteribacter lacisalsi]|uniref:EamA family transporter n=1 Tax=Alteribacter lacisalsi TaxID=2045244 RepID=A0A2W0HA73_9BACI|nr:DMT family transporter [Alteribacter lacisalsi]PYZ98753.1 EamA family transporter [Alteribacter lacisalsi]